MPFEKGKTVKGAGRQKGSTTKPQIKDYFTKQEIVDLVNSAKDKAEQGDQNLMKFLLEQIFGKAPQSLEIPNGEGQIIFKWKNQK